MTTFVEEAGDTPEAFAINSEERANWLLRKLANIEAEKARVQAQAAAIAAQLESDANSLRARFEGELQEWARQQIQGGKRKSLTLLQGTLAFRTVPPSIRVADANAASEFASSVFDASFDDCWRREFVAGSYRKHAERILQETGEVLPGIETAPARESFSIRFGKGE